MLSDTLCDKVYFVYLIFFVCIYIYMCDCVSTWISVCLAEGKFTVMIFWFTFWFSSEPCYTMKLPGTVLFQISVYIQNNCMYVIYLLGI